MTIQESKRVEEYVERQCGCKVIHLKQEQTYAELGHEVIIWNVKTDKDGAWWVAEGGGLPMNLYSQDKPYYFSTDEVFSFHIGIMQRLLADEACKPETIVSNVAKCAEISPDVRRMLYGGSQVLIEAVEIEEIQSIGMTCRETLLKLIKNIYDDKFLSSAEESPKIADFKNRSRISIDKLLVGSENADLRDHLRKVAYAAWDWANKVTHSTSSTIHDASICLTLCSATVSTFESMQDKANDDLVNLQCKNCGSRRLSVAHNDDTADLLIVCELCSHGFLLEKN